MSKLVIVDLGYNPDPERPDHELFFETEEEAMAYIAGLTDLSANASDFPEEDANEAFISGLIARSKHSNIKNVVHEARQTGCPHVVKFYGDHQ